MKIPVLVYILNTYREYDLKFLCFTHTLKLKSEPELNTRE